MEAILTLPVGAKVVSSTLSKEPGDVYTRGNAATPFSLPASKLRCSSCSSSQFSSCSPIRKCRRKNQMRRATATMQESLSTDSSTSLPLRPSSAELAKTVVELCSEGTLSTLEASGWPLGTYVQFALDIEGSPILLLDRAAIHAGHVEANQSCSLFLQLELPGHQKILTTLKGKVLKSTDPQARKKLASSWQRRFGEEVDDSQDLYSMKVEQVLQAGNMGRGEVWVDGQEYLAATADPLRECAASIVSDFNKTYWEDLRCLCSIFADVEGQVEEARLTWVDRLGFDMHVLMEDPQEFREVRIPFSREVKDEREARSALTMMAQMAWERERPLSGISFATTLQIDTTAK